MGSGHSAERLFLALGVAGFALLGALTGRHVRPDPLPVAVYAVALALLALAVLKLLGWGLAVGSPAVRRQLGLRALDLAVGRGSLMILPFAALAGMAELYLGWNAAQAFTAAGTMAAGAAIGSEVVKLGANRVAGMIVPLVSSMLLSSGWLALSAVVQGLWRG